MNYIEILNSIYNKNFDLLQTKQISIVLILGKILLLLEYFSIFK